MPLNSIDTNQLSPNASFNAGERAALSELIGAPPRSDGGFSGSALALPELAGGPPRSGLEFSGNTVALPDLPNAGTTALPQPASSPSKRGDADSQSPQLGAAGAKLTAIMMALRGTVAARRDEAKGDAAPTPTAAPTAASRDETAQAKQQTTTSADGSKAVLTDSNGNGRFGDTGDTVEVKSADARSTTSWTVGGSLVSQETRGADGGTKMSTVSLSDSAATMFTAAANAAAAGTGTFDGAAFGAAISGVVAAAEDSRGKGNATGTVVSSATTALL
jgi:hypothetical protein